MAFDGALLFFKPLANSGALVFGDIGDSAGAPAASVSIDADIADAPPQLTLRYGAPLGADCAFDDAVVPADLQLAWDSNTNRALLAFGRAHLQDARPASSAARAAWQDAARRTTHASAHWQDARAATTAARTAWQRTQALALNARSHLQDALPATTDARVAWQQTLALRGAWREHMQEALPLSADARVHFEEMLRLARAARPVAQWALPILTVRRPPLRTALRLPIVHRPHWQQAMRPRPGLSPRPLPPDGKHLCYDPATLGQLVFERAFTGTGELVFVCHHAGGGVPEQPPATLVLARRRTYIVINSIEVRRVDTNALLPALDSGFSMQLERGSWTWGFNVEFHASALPLLQPDANGLPVELEVKVNGQPFRMMAESLSRSVKFPRAVVRVTGASPAVLLDAPWAPQQSFTQDALISAEQLMLQVLTVGGVSMGWTLDWQITDWTIPAGTWAHQGTWISAINDIAGSVGAYVQPHDTAHTLRILPAWPVRSWLIPSATPDIELPPGIAAVEEVRWIAKPAYDSLYLRGEAGTFNYYRKRSGTPGTVGAPMVVHPLLIAAAAADQRAIAELSDTSRQVEQQLQLMVHPETGIIKPGTLLRYTDDAAVVRTGITREVSVQMAGSKLTQTIRVQAPEVA